MERMIGKKAPGFKMMAVSGDGENFFEVKLDDYRGKWLVLFFYPLDFTFVCPTEITGFSQYYDKFKAANAEILAISCDSHYSHQAWIRDGLGKISYPIAADKTMKAASDYGVLIEEDGVALRGLFIIDPDQIVRYSVIHDLNVGRSMEETLRVLKAFQTGGLCAASWNMGEKNLTPEETPAKTPVLRSSERAVIYTMPDCSYCKKVKEFFQENSIAYQEVNLSIDKEGQAFMQNRGYTALPVTVIGQTEITGYNMNKIKEAFGL